MAKAKNKEKGLTVQQRVDLFAVELNKFVAELSAKYNIGITNIVKPPVAELQFIDLLKKDEEAK